MLSVSRTPPNSEHFSGRELKAREREAAREIETRSAFVEQVRSGLGIGYAGRAQLPSALHDSTVARVVQGV
jgi:hypothetical protein